MSNGRRLAVLLMLLAAIAAGILFGIWSYEGIST